MRKNHSAPQTNTVISGVELSKYSVICKTSISVSYIFTIPLHIRELDSPQVDQLEAGFCTRERALKSHKEPSIVAMASMASSSVGHITCMLHGHIRTQNSTSSAVPPCTHRCARDYAQVESEGG